MQHLIIKDLNKAFTPLSLNSSKNSSYCKQSKQLLSKFKVVKLPSVSSRTNIHTIQEICSNQVCNKQIENKLGNSYICDNSIFSPRNMNFEFKVDSQKILELKVNLKTKINLEHQLVSQINQFDQKLERYQANIIQLQEQMRKIQEDTLLNL